MVDTPLTWDDDDDANSFWDTDVYNREVKDQAAALDVMLTTAAGDLIYATGERELARLPAPTGFTEPILSYASGAPVWVERNDVITSGGETFGTEEIASHPLTGSLFRWEIIRDGTTPVSLVEDRWLSLALYANGGASVLNITSADVRNLTGNAVAGSNAIPTNYIQWRVTTTHNTYIHKNADNHLMINRTSSSFFRMRVYEIGLH